MSAMVALSALYSAVTTVLLKTYLPADESFVNQFFVSRAWPILLVLAAVLWVVAFLYSKKHPVQSATIPADPFKLQLSDLLLLLLPLTPIAQYVLTNQDILSFTGGLLVMGVFATLAALLALVIPQLLSRFGLGNAPMMMGLAFCFTLFNMAALTGSHEWYQRGSLPVQLSVLGVVFVLLCVVYSYIGPCFTRAVVVLFFAGNSLISYLNYEKPDTSGLSFDDNNMLVQLVGSRQPKVTPDIYILVYDGYVANETMLNYGIDNSAQERYLVAAGFKLYPHTYSLAAYTVGTMSRVFSVTNAFTGGRRSAAAGNGAVHQLLQGFGYQTYGLFWSDYYFQENGSFYDHSYPNLRPAHWLLCKAILMGEFRFDTDFEAPTRAEFMEHKDSVWMAGPGMPKVVYMHANRPNHTQNSGKCLPDERELFRVRLGEANSEMKRNVDDLLRLDPDAIIVVASDHGPYLTKNCTSTGDHYEKSEITREDMQDRYGTFLAIYWPEQFDSAYDDIIVIQDIFPAIFSVIFADDRYLRARVKPRTVRSKRASGVSIRNGIIEGGVNHGEPLFLSPRH